MSNPSASKESRVLYLQQIEINTTTRAAFRVKLQVEGKDVEMRHEQRTATWTPVDSLQVPDESKITVILKAGHKFGGISFGRLEAQAEISSQEATQAYWGSIDSVASNIVFDKRPAIVTFKFRPSRSFEATRMAVDNLQKEMENYRSLMKSATEQYVDIALNIGSAVADMLNPMAKVAFILAKATFDVLKEQRKYDETVSELALEVDRILPFARRTVNDVLHDDADVLEAVVKKLYELIVDAATFLCAYAKQSPAVRTLKSAILPDDHAKITNLQDEFRKLKEDFDRAVDVEALRLARKQEIGRVIEILRPVREANYQDDRGCMEGTRRSVLDEIVSWAGETIDSNTTEDSPTSASVLWLYGMPGLGKTSVANSLCYRLHKSGNLGGSFFCKRDDPALREPKRIMPTLISKLAAMWSPYRTSVAQLLRDDPQLNPESMNGDLLLKPLSALQKSPSRVFVLVIDALDECGDSATRRNLLGCLLNACKRVNWLKIVITSRPESDIQSFFETNELIGRDLGAEKQTESDIRLFAKARFTQVATRHYLAKDWPGITRLAQVLERSGGLFIFVETMSRHLDDDPDPESPLGMILSGRLEDANTELHKLYMMTIASRVGGRTEAFRSVARAIVGTAKYRPLCEETLASLTGLEPRIIKTWVDNLSSLLYRDASQNGGIRFRHLSILEFLTGPHCPSEFLVDVKQANMDLGRSCLTIMTRQLKFNICQLETSCSLNSEIEDLKDRVQQRISDSLQYSSMYWSDHLCSDLDPVSEEVCGLLGAFFAREQPLYWLEVLSLMGEVPAGILALRQIREYNKKFDEDIHHIVEDMLRFVLAFSTPISASAPHLYVSALPFMPIESGLWGRVKASFPSLVNVREGRMQQWPARQSMWLGHTNAIRRVAYSPNGRSVVSGSDDATIRIWDEETGAAVGEPLIGHTGSVSSVAYSPNGRHIISCSQDTTIRIWDATTGAPVGEPLTGHTSDVMSAVYSLNGQQIVSGSADQTVRIWDAKTGAAVRDSLTGHTGSIWTVAYSPNGQNIISCSSDQTIRIWDSETGAAVGEPLRGHTDEIGSISYSPNGQYIISGCDDHTIRLWDAKTGAAVGEPWRGHTAAVWGIAYSPSGQRVVSGSSDRTIRVWDVKTGTTVGNPLMGHTDAIWGMAYSPDGQHFISGSYDQTVRIWDAKTGAPVGESSSGHIGAVLSVVYSPDGRHIVSGSRDQSVRIWYATTGAALGEPLKGHSSDISNVLYSPDGKSIISSSLDGTIQIWDAAAGSAVGERLKGHTEAVWGLAFSPNGQHIVSGSHDQTIRIWDAKTGAAVGDPFKGHTDTVWCVKYSPNGQHIISGSSDQTVRIWDVAAGTAVGEPLTGHTGWIYSVAYSPNGQYIASSSQDQTIRVWDAITGTAVWEPLIGHSNAVWSVAYSPDGQYIISGSQDQTIRFWDATTGAASGEPLTGHASEVNCVAYSPYGQRIISGTNGQMILIWDAANASPNGNRSIVFSFEDLSKYISTGVTSDPYPSSDFTIAKALLDSNGWVHYAGGLLFWVPEDCRIGLSSHVAMVIPPISRHRRVRLDFTNFRYGPSWTNVYGGA